MKVCVYGSRGSIPFSTHVSKFGGNTSCMTIESAGEELVIDAGSGLFAYSEKLRIKNKGRHGEPPVHILLSHLHIDHIIGFGTFAPAWKGRKIKVYTLNRDARPLMEQVFGIFKPPYWPSSMLKLNNIEVIEIFPNVPFNIGVFTVIPFSAIHPDDTVSFYMTDGKKRMVHMLDSEPESDNIDCVIGRDYLVNSDLVVYDASYAPDEYPKFAGWGHSTVKHGVALQKKWNVKLMMFSHFAQHYNDDDLESLKTYFDSDRFILAHDGLEFDI